MGPCPPSPAPLKTPTADTNLSGFIASRGLFKMKFRDDIDIMNTLSESDVWENSEDY